MASSAENSDADLRTEVTRTMEDAAIRGLCLEGQKELAVSTVLHLRPDWSAGQALAYVNETTKG